MSGPRRSLFAFALGAAVVGAGCGSGATSPTAALPLDQPRAQGATIAGTVNGGVSSSATATRSSSASAAGIRVSIEGTGLVTTTVGGGRFVLNGVPSGKVSLRFQGPGIDARLEISGLSDGQVLTLNVRVSGSDAEIETEPSSGPSPSPSPSASPSPGDDDGDEVEFKGTVESVTPPSLMVSGRSVRTDASTKIKRDDETIALSDIKVGENVEVEGTSVAGSTEVLARKIKVDDDESNDDDSDDDADEDD